MDMKKETFKVGDRVFDYTWGWGTIRHININEIIEVEFDSKRFITFLCDGRFSDCCAVTLSFTEYTLQGFSQERPVELPQAGELCLVRDYNDDTWLAREFAEYRHGLFICQAFYGQGEVEWKYMKRIKILD